MTTTAAATFAITAWDEKTWEGQPAAEVKTSKATHASVRYQYEGAFTGESRIEYVMVYVDEVNGNWVAMERLTGTLGDRTGSFALQYSGSFDKVAVHGTGVIVPNSGTGELAGLTGTTELSLAGHQERYPVTFHYTVADPA